MELLHKQSKEKVAAKHKRKRGQKKLGTAPFRQKMVIKRDHQEIERDDCKPGIREPLARIGMDEKRVADRADNRIFRADEKAAEHGKKTKQPLLRAKSK